MNVSNVTSYGIPFAFGQLVILFAHCTGHNQYDGKRRDRKNTQDKKEKSDAFFHNYLKFSFRMFYDYKHSIP